MIGSQLINRVCVAVLTTSLGCPALQSLPVDTTPVDNMPQIITNEFVSPDDTRSQNWVDTYIGNIKMKSRLDVGDSGTTIIFPGGEIDIRIKGKPSKSAVALAKGWIEGAAEDDDQ